MTRENDVKKRHFGKRSLQIGERINKSRIVVENSVNKVIVLRRKGADTKPTFV